MKKKSVLEKKAQQSKTVTIKGKVVWETEEHPATGIHVSAINENAEWKKDVDLDRDKTGKNGTFGLSIPAELCEKGGYMGIDLIFKNKDGVIIHQIQDLIITSAEKVTEVNVCLSEAKKALAEQRKIKQERTVIVGGIELNARVLKELKPEGLLNIARALNNDEKLNKRDLENIKKLSPQLLLEKPTKESRHIHLSATPIREALDEIIRLKRWPRAVSLDLEAIITGRIYRLFATQVHNCGDFVITYETTGPAAVDLSTAAEDVLDPGTTNVLTTLPAGGVPTYIKRVCFWLQRALNAYKNPPFSLRDPSAGGPINCFIINTQFGSAGSSGMNLGNVMEDDLLCAVAVHELFHMVQFEYTINGAWRSSIMEGGATYSEDSAADSMNRYLDEAADNFNGPGLLVNPNISLIGASYKCSLFWRYIAEQHSPRIQPSDEPTIGVETYKAIIEAVDAGGATTDVIRAAVHQLPWYQAFNEFRYLDPARFDRESSETTIGNFALACYLKGLGNNVPDRRFDFMEDEENIHIDDVIRIIMPTLAASDTLRDVAIAGSGNLTTTASNNFIGSLNALGRQFFEVNVDAAVTNFTINFQVTSGLTDPIFQVVLIDEDNNVRDIHRTDYTSYTKMITNIRDGKRLSKIALIVAGGEVSGNFTINTVATTTSPDVMVTRWHSMMKNEYEIDSRNWAWTWVSPDIWVDNNSDGIADSQVFFNQNNKLNIRLHNKGNQNASNVQVEFYYQNAAGGLHDADWMPVRNLANSLQTLTGLSLAAGNSQNFEVDWAPVPDGTSDHFCIKAVVNSPGEINTDNKRVLSNFGNVVLPFSGIIDLTLLRRNIFDFDKVVTLRVIPRLNPHIKVSQVDLKQQKSKHLRAGESTLDSIRLYHDPAKKVTTDHQNHKFSEDGYTTPKEALPPGIDGANLITVVHEVDGLSIGGVSFNVKTESSKIIGKKNK